ncbi:DNA polymerase I [Klebsormidium nitens]|uniref:DNA polymerase I n=1 Tax=Klebsormidium nitens TaxID=105231 RepID=A0A1Y1IBA5_KLENI|nr:DNA polymerase I [Klebsormidium nitens]|eukprot:GAQ87242.1 DNA polymerase I [Klebsormidium nitens]
MLQPRQGRLLLVDGMAVAYRAYFKIGAKLVWNETRHASQEYPEAEEILTTLTFVSNLVTLLNLVPTHVGVVFDAGGKNFRHELFPQYKQHRAAMPDTLRNSMGLIKSSVRGLGLTIIERHGVEADDVIASLAMRGVKAGMEVRVASPDKDFFQILGPNLRLLRPRPKGIGIDSFGLEEFEAKFEGLRVDQFADMQALMGDQADNIPGVFGIGPKTASNLLKKYGTLDVIIAKRESVMPQRVRTALCNEYELLPAFKRLVVLRTELDDLHTGHLEAMEFGVPSDVEAATNFLDALAANVQNGDVEARSIKNRIEQIWNALDMRRRARISR